MAMHSPGTERSPSKVMQRALLRPRNGRVIGGVCAGIARRFRLDAVVVRMAFCLATLLLGLGLIVYLVAWPLIPNDSPPTLSDRPKEA